MSRPDPAAPALLVMPVRLAACPGNQLDHICRAGRLPEDNRLIEQALAQPTAERANPYWRAAAARIVQDQPHTWLYYLDELAGRNNRVQGTRIDALSTYQRFWEWWVRGGSPAAAPTS